MMKKKQIDFTASDDEDIKIRDEFKIIDCFLYAVVDTNKIELSEFMTNQSVFSHENLKYKVYEQSSGIRFHHDKSISHQNSTTSKFSKSVS